MRLELFFKTAGELQALIALVRQNGIGAVNLVNKAKADPLLQQIRTIKAALPHVDVVPHYSLKYQYRNGSADLTFEATRDFCAAAAEAGAREVLLISGSGPKKQLDAVSCLERFAEERRRAKTNHNHNQHKKRPRDSSGVAAEQEEQQGEGSPLDRLTFGVAYNPYLPEEGGLFAEEARRLKAKLATGVVSSVWLQMGADATKLRKGLELLKAESAGRDPPVRVVGSLAIPTRKFIAMMKFRPWGGVYLSEEYLSGVEAADEATRRILDVYREFSVEPIVETAVKTDADLLRVKELVGEDLYFQPLAAPDDADDKACQPGDGEDGKGGNGGGGVETRARKKARSG